LDIEIISKSAICGYDCRISDDKLDIAAAWLYKKNSFQIKLKGTNNLYSKFNKKQKIILLKEIVKIIYIITGK
jgi:hypothetical protein